MSSHKDCTPPAATIGASRRVVMTSAACAVMLPVAVPALAETPATAEDETFMRMAIEEARQGDFPFGTVIVRDGKVIARGFNMGLRKDDPTAHGEIVAIRNCLAEHGSAALVGSTLYTSGESCAMCMGAILWCKMGRLVFGASIEQLATKIGQIMVSDAYIASKTPFVTISITGGVLAEEAMKLFP